MQNCASCYYNAVTNLCQHHGPKNPELADSLSRKGHKFGASPQAVASTPNPRLHGLLSKSQEQQCWMPGSTSSAKPCPTRPWKRSLGSMQILGHASALHMKLCSGLPWPVTILLRTPKRVLHWEVQVGFGHWGNIGVILGLYWDNGK